MSNLYVPPKPPDFGNDPKWTEFYKWLTSYELQRAKYYEQVVLTQTRISLPFPVTDDSAYDSSPIGAIHITKPTTASTRDFAAGIWVETDGNAVDKGRGIIVENSGASDGIYVQLEGASGTGIAVLLTETATSATGAVIGTTLSTHVGLEVRQETAVDASAAGVLIELHADGAATEMVRVGSTIDAQVGIIFRMFGSGAEPIVVQDSGGTSLVTISNTGSAFFEAPMQFGATAQTTNNGQTVTVGNVGPGSGSVAIQEWRITLNAAGATRYIPLFG